MDGSIEAEKSDNNLNFGNITNINTKSINYSMSKDFSLEHIYDVFFIEIIMKNYLCVKCVNLLFCLYLLKIILL